MKNRPRLIGARPDFYMISDIPNVRLGTVDCSLYIRYIAVRINITRKEWTCLRILLWSAIISKLWQRFSSFPSDKSSSFKKLFSTRLQFFRVLFHWIKTLHSLDQTLEIHFGISNLISDQYKIVRGQPIVVFDAAHYCRLHVTARKALNFPEGISSILIDKSKYHYVVVFDLTSMQVAT